MLVYNKIQFMIENNKNEENLFSIIEYLRAENYLDENNENVFEKECSSHEKMKAVEADDDNHQCKNNNFVCKTQIKEDEVVIENKDFHKNETDNDNENENENEIVNYAQINRKIVCKVETKTENRIKNLKIFHGVPSFEKKSQFLSHFAFVSNIEEVYEFRNNIINDKKYSRATHNIFAYRFICPLTGI